MAELEKKTLKIDGIETAYWSNKFNKKHSALIMVHGFRGDHRGMLKIAAELGGAYNLFIPDLPGFGDSAPFHNRRHDVTAYATFLDSFIGRLNLKTNPNILAHSFGTTVSSAFVAEFPDKVDKLILLSPIATHPVPRALYTAIRPAMALLRVLPECLGRAITANWLVTDVMSAMTTKTKNRELKKWIKDEHRQYFNGFATHKAMIEAMAASNQDHVAMFAEQIPNQTLIIAGDKDGVGKYKHQNKLYKVFPNASTVTIKDVGHLTHYEAPKEVAAAIRQFLG